jgi:hypothetical protein
MYTVQGGMGCSSSMKFEVPPVPMSTAASSENPRFHGKKRLPMVSVDGMTVSFARQPSLLTLFVRHA